MSKEPPREKSPKTEKQPPRELPVNDHRQDQAGLPPDKDEAPPEKATTSRMSPRPPAGDKGRSSLYGPG